jgi:hypothetical protein
MFQQSGKLEKTRISWAQSLRPLIAETNDPAASIKEVEEVPTSKVSLI